MLVSRVDAQLNFSPAEWSDNSVKPHNQHESGENIPFELNPIPEMQPTSSPESSTIKDSSTPGPIQTQRSPFLEALLRILGLLGKSDGVVLH